MASVPTIVRAAAAAILSSKQLSEAQKATLDGQRFFLHPHVAEVDPEEPALIGYLNDIYNTDTKPPIDVASPASPSFRLLATKSKVIDATRGVAEALTIAMESTRANPGIVFGFLLQTSDSKSAYGVIKADLEADQRFFMDLKSDDEWTIGSVRDVLPPPQTNYAKYAISPRPVLPGTAGIRDVQAETDSAAGYFLHAIGVVVPQRTGTKRAVAQAAKQVGYEDGYIRKELRNVVKDTPVEAVLAESFPDVVERSRVSLTGSDVRPMHTVVADDPYLTTWFTRVPHFKLTVDETVDVQTAGRVITVTLPEGHDPIDRKYEK